VSGSGIGLALCKEIVELHHGSLKVDSKLGVGTTFTTTLQAGNSHFTMEQIVFGDTEPSDNTQTSRNDYKAAPEGACRVVLAEDNSEMRAFLFNNLAEHYEVIEAVDGKVSLTAEQVKSIDNLLNENKTTIAQLQAEVETLKQKPADTTKTIVDDKKTSPNGRTEVEQYIDTVNSARSLYNLV
jgi:light-regulated signal transduction histidine kinase (bacteriophytochrome)